MARGVTAQQTTRITECGPGLGGGGQEVTWHVEGTAGFASRTGERRQCRESEVGTKYGGALFTTGRCFGFVPQAEVVGARGNLGGSGKATAYFFLQLQDKDLHFRASVPYTQNIKIQVSWASQRGTEGAGEQTAQALDTCGAWRRARAIRGRHLRKLCFPTWTGTEAIFEKTSKCSSS